MKVTNKNKQQFMNDYINRTIDDMDLDALTTLAQEYLESNLSRLSNDELENQIKEYYPELLEDN
jgi:di/tripeptidase